MVYRREGRDIPGSGLSLVIVKTIAERHRAQIALHDCDYGFGLVVCLTFLRCESHLLHSCGLFFPGLLALKLALSLSRYTHRKTSCCPESLRPTRALINYFGTCYG